jgi:hypothetical protein
VGDVWFMVRIQSGCKWLMQALKSSANLAYAFFLLHTLQLAVTNRTVVSCQ